MSTDKELWQKLESEWAEERRQIINNAKHLLPLSVEQKLKLLVLRKVFGYSPLYSRVKSHQMII